MRSSDLGEPCHEHITLLPPTGDPLLRLRARYERRSIETGKQSAGPRVDSDTAAGSKTRFSKAAAQRADGSHPYVAGCLRIAGPIAYRRSPQHPPRRRQASLASANPIPASADDGRGADAARTVDIKPPVAGTCGRKWSSDVFTKMPALLPLNLRGEGLRTNTNSPISPCLRRYAASG